MGEGGRVGGWVCEGKGVLGVGGRGWKGGWVGVGLQTGGWAGFDLWVVAWA